MSVDSVLSRISEIQSQIASLQSGATTAATSSTAATAGGASSTAFADALASATGDTDGAGATTASTATAAATSVDAGKGTIATGSGATGADVVADAKKYLGVPYVFGGTTRSGMDCSGLVQTVFKDLGVTMPRVVPDQADMGVAVPSLAQAQPGDLIIPKGEGHIVIYVGDGKVLHAPHPGKDVRIVDNWLKDSDIATIRRIVPSAQDAAASAARNTTGVSSIASLLQASGLGGSGMQTSALGTAALGGSSGTDLQTAALMSLLNGGSTA